MVAVMVLAFAWLVVTGGLAITFAGVVFVAFVVGVFGGGGGGGEFADVSADIAGELAKVGLVGVE